MKTGVILLLLISIIFLMSGCVNTASVEEPVETANQIANPASVYCEEQGHTLEIRNSERGQVGICITSVGKECEEWEFYNGECEL